MFRLTLFGVLDLRGADGASLDTALRRSKRIALLAYLAAARPRGYHRRDKIAALFWPELPEDRARAALRTTLSRLRDDCGVEIILGRGADEIAIDPALLECDVVAFDEAVNKAEFDAAAALYQGPLLDGVHIDGTGEEFETWIATERGRLHAAALRAHLSLVAAASARGDSTAAIAAARRTLELAPTDEPVARRLIALLLEAGDRGGAMREYDELARRLRRDFDVAPSAETTALLRGARSAFDAPDTTEAAAASSTNDRAESATSNIAYAKTTGVSVRARWFFAAAALFVLAIWFSPRSTIARGIAKAGELPAPAVQWNRLRADGDSRPVPRVHNVILLDSTNDALLLIGGIVSRGESAALSPVLGDLWRLNGLGTNGSHRWTRVTPAPGPAPAARWQAFGAYDAAHDRAILHGGALGHSSPCANDTWILERASGIGGTPRWKEVRIDGARPPLRAQMQGFFDPRSRTIVTVSGNDCFATYFSDVWRLTFDDSTLSTGHWTHLAPDSSAGAPDRRNGDAVAYDPIARRLWIHGGNVGAPHQISDLWRLDHADGSDGTPSWHPVRCVGESPTLSNHVAAYDTVSGTLIVYTGTDVRERQRNDVWYARGLADGGNKCVWQHAATDENAPLPRGSARGVLLPGGAIIMVGGDIEGLALVDIWRAERAR